MTRVPRLSSEANLFNTLNLLLDVSPYSYTTKAAVTSQEQRRNTVFILHWWDTDSTLSFYEHNCFRHYRSL
jgi:hypothetical protein